ncbi:MAG: hypothetical protein Q3983_09780 [Capnocytophaga sp.]|nr:hypothetical protein [Capnocytophaga sp.]
MILDTIHKRKAFAITLVILILLIIAMFLSGMKYLVPPPEKGILITFGTDSKGMGEINPPKISEPVVSPKNVEETPETPVIDDTPEKVPEEILTNDQAETESVVIPKKDKPKKEPKPPTPKPSSEVNDALASIMNANVPNPRKGNGDGNQGDDKVPGYKGDPKGDPYSNSFYGNGEGGGKGDGKGWGLNGRNLKEGAKIKQECNQAGKVVVEVTVDRTGKVIKAEVGKRGTTNTAPCLAEAAKKTALTYRWNADENAPERQIGWIVINFKLGE